MATKNDEYWMAIAIEEAQRVQGGDWPFGAIIVQDTQIIARAHNEEYVTNDAGRHAEILAVSRAGATQSNRYLQRATLFTTHEPCTMCSGAILNAKVGRVVIGSRRSDRPDLFHQRNHNIELLATDGRRHQTRISWNVLHQECLALLADINIRQK